MNWFKNLFSFTGTAKRSEFIRKLFGCALVVWLAALVDEQVIGPYLCSQDPLKVGCIPGEVKLEYALEDFIAVLSVMPLVAVVLLAVMVRRMNDHGKSPWLLLLALTGVGILPLLYWFVTRSRVQAD
ncbi:MAG: DUF805 domain-containing protein [Pseudomonadota bacterium]